jgi:hypothetical protein
MKKFPAEKCLFMGRVLGLESGWFENNIRNGTWSKDTIIPREIADAFIEQHRNVLRTCKTFALPVSAKSCQEIIQHLEGDSPKVARFCTLNGELLKRMEHELEAQLFLHLAPNDAALYQQPLEDWEKTLAKREMATRFDIEEASKCLALHRGTACVFHMMRLMEVGLKDITKELQITLEWHERSWEKMLTKINDEMTRRNKLNDPGWTESRPFFEGAYASLNAVRVAWRNPTMHVEKKYDPDDAGEISSMVRIFMEYLYTTLS